MTDACHKYDEKMLREKMKDKPNCQKILSEGYGRNHYFARLLPGQVREYFSTWVKMLPLAGNVSHDQRFRRTNWLSLCGEQEQQELIVRHCKNYDDIPERYSNLENDDS